MKSHQHPRRSRAYSLIEVLVATGVISTGIAIAVSLSLATVSQEEAGNNQARALAAGEAAATLYRLGLSGPEIRRILPKDPVVHDITISEGTAIIASAGTLERAEITVEFDVTPASEVWAPGTWTGGPGGSDSRRSEVIRVLRPTVSAGAY